jgi:plastocyanin
MLEPININNPSLCKDYLSSFIVQIDKGSDNTTNNMHFEPGELTISKGTTITWLNDDNTIHTIAVRNPESGISGIGFESGYLSPGMKFQYRFNTP